MTHSTFAERFAYARTLRLVATGDYPSKAEIGRAVQRTGQAVGPWEGLDEPPTDWRVHTPLAAYLGVPERWLIRGEGEPPRPAFWAAWLTERREAGKALEAVKEAQRRPQPVDATDERVRRAIAAGAKVLPVAPVPGKAGAKKLAARRKPKRGGAA